ncbi:MAG: hypothetical protein ABJA87_01440 [bacterium]
MSGDRERRRGRDAADGYPDVELVPATSFEDELEPLPPRRPVPRAWWVALAAAGAVLVAVLAYQSRTRDAATTPAPSRSSAAVADSPRAGSTPTLAIPRGAVTVTQLGRPVVPAVPGTDLFARGPSALVRVELATGRITRTPLPSLSSDGPVSLLVGPDRAIIRPLDFVPGYVVPDGRAPRTLDVVALSSGQVFAGPDARHMWVPTLDGARMRLVDLDGRASGPVLQAPVFGSRPDGDGYLAYADTSGVYDARPEGSRRITTGELQAVGPTGWLVAECDVRHRCGSVLIDRVTGHRRALGPRRGASDPTGVLSADASTAALIEVNRGPTPRLILIDLRSGHARSVGMTLAQNSLARDLVWSPDGRFLFTVDGGGRIVVVDRTGHVGRLPVTLPPVTQLALRAPAR